MRANSAWRCSSVRSSCSRNKNSGAPEYCRAYGTRSASPVIARSYLGSRARTARGAPRRRASRPRDVARAGGAATRRQATRGRAASRACPRTGATARARPSGSRARGTSSVPTGAPARGTTAASIQNVAAGASHASRIGRHRTSPSASASCSRAALRDRHDGAARRAERPAARPRASTPSASGASHGLVSRLTALPRLPLAPGAERRRTSACPCDALEFGPEARTAARGSPPAARASGVSPALALDHLGQRVELSPGAALHGTRHAAWTSERKRGRWLDNELPRGAQHAPHAVQRTIEVEERIWQVV